MSFIGKMFASLRGGPVEQYNITKFQMDSKVLSVTHNVAVEGAQAITGAGFQPSGGVIFCTVDNTLAASWAVFDTTKTLGTLSANRGGSAGAYEPHAQMSLYLTGGTAAFTITSLDADGLTITWAKASSPTGTATLKFLLFR